MSTAQELLDAEGARWSELTAMLERLGADEWERAGVAGDWSAKDVIAHIAAWHAEAVDEMEQLRETGHVKRAFTDVESFNQQNYQGCKDISLQDARITSGACRHRFREEIARMSEPLNPKMATMLAGCAHEHYDEHIALLEAFLAGRA